MEFNFLNLLPIIYAVFYGITMKIADLLDEHGLRWFKGSAILFGFLWGIFGALIITSNSILANIYLAMILAFILRRKIDYYNHGIAVVIMFLSFFATQAVLWNILIIFLAIFVVFGLATDYVENKEIPKNTIILQFRKFLDLRAQYYLFPFIYSLMFNNWLIFFVVASNMLFYEITLRYGMRVLQSQQNNQVINR